MPIAVGPVEGATPLGPDELAGLKPASILTHADLNAAEASNILKAMNWAARSRRADLLGRTYVAELHRRMFGDVWGWAGQWRQRETNIGVPPSDVLVRLEELLQDARYWREHETFHVDEAAVRLHHRMVQIHPFANGNGRHTRLMADLTVQQSGGEAFSWGGRDLAAPGDARRTYIGALRQADAGDIGALLAFARS